MRKENKESYNLRKGDILRVEAGTTHYIINRDNKEQLFIAKLLETISVPGEVQVKFTSMDDLMVIFRRVRVPLNLPCIFNIISSSCSHSLASEVATPNLTIRASARIS